MPCYFPLKGYRARSVNESGKRSIVFNRRDGFADLPVEVPCGQCIGCRLERSRQWAIRCMHEASLHEDNCFITLTYDDEHLPADGGLHVEHMQKFFKRLRKSLHGEKIRYFHCGEYGEQYKRPHYHACIFGYTFPDQEFFKTTNNIHIYTSPALRTLWPFGFSTVGSLTFESAAYTARYILKKVTGSDDLKQKAYERVCPDTGEIFQVQPEYTTMSRRPGIGHGWYQKYKGDCYPSDFIVMRGRKMQPPKYYDGLYEHIDDMKQKRRQRAMKHKNNNTRERLLVRERVKLAQIKFLKRTVE